MASGGNRDVRAGVSWPDATITGQQFLDRTRGFVALLADRLPQFPHRQLYNWKERRLEVLEADLSNYDELLAKGQDEEREGTLRPAHTAYSWFTAGLLFGPRRGSHAFKLMHELSRQEGSNTVTFDFAPDHQNEEFVISIFFWTLEYWRPEMGYCGSFSIIRDLAAGPAYADKRPITGMIFRKDPAFTRDLPEFVRVTEAAGGFVLQVIDDAPFAYSPEGRRKVGQLFELLAARGLLDLPSPPPKPPQPPPLTEAQRRILRIGGASAPPKPRRTSRNETE